MYVYNPVRNTVLEFSGREYYFEKDKVTVLRDQLFWAPDEYRRNLSNGSPEDRAAIHEMVIPAAKFADMLFGNRHYLNLKDSGFVVTEQTPTADEKREGMDKAVVWKLKAIDEFLNERRERQSGGQGRLAPDQEVIDWMRELNIYDPLYNPAPVGATAAENERLATLVATAVSNAILNPKTAEAVKK